MIRLNKLFLVSIFLLTIFSIGAVCAADNVTADNLAVDNDGDELAIDSSSSDNLKTNGEDIAVGDNVNSSGNSKLCENANDVLSDPVTPKYTIDVDLPEAASGRYNLQWGQSIKIHGLYENATGNVTVTFADESYTCFLDKGAFDLEITKYKKISNNQNLIVKYNGDSNFKSVSKTLYIHVKLDDVVANGADYGQIAFIDVNLHNATGNVSFTYNGRTYNGKLENGRFIQEFTNYTLGKNNVDFYYSGDDKYNSISKSLSFTVNANINEPTIYNLQPAIINVYLGDATGKVNFTFNGQTYVADIKNGIASQEIPNYAIGENTVEVKYSGDSKFNQFTKEIKFTVLDKQDSEIYAGVYQNNGVNVVSVYIPYSNGTVNVTINGKQHVLELVDCLALYPISASDDIKNIKVVYAGNERLNAGKTSTFLKLNNVVNADSWKYYFNQNNGGKLFDFIPEGITLDFQGKIINDNPDPDYKCFIVISKPVNVISSTKDAYIDLNTTAGSLLGENPGNRFTVSYGGSGSNISGIYLHNTQLWISNTSHVVFDNISVVVEDQRVGSGVGATSVRDNSSYILIKNSYFYTRNNGGSTTFTFSWANYCTFDNNTVKAEGNVGNLLYLNIYNIAGLPDSEIKGPVNSYNKFTNNRVYGKEGSAISVGIMVEGMYNIIENNTLYKCSISTSVGSKNAHDNYYIGNVLIEGAGITAQPNSILYNNIAPGTFNTGVNSTAYNNTVLKAMTVGAGSEVYNNTVGGFTLSGAGSSIHDNTVNGITKISQANINVYNNNFIGDNAIQFSNTNAKNVIFKNNYVLGYIEFTANAKNNTIANNTIVTSQDYAVNLNTYTDTNCDVVDNYLSSKDKFGNAAVNHVEDETLVVDNYQNAVATISVDVNVNNAKVGETVVFTVVTNETSISSATIIVGTKTYNVSLSNGKGSISVNDLLAGQYDVVVVSNDNTFSARNTTKLNVTKNAAPEIVVEIPKITQGSEAFIVVKIGDATGSVTLNINGEDIKSDLKDGIATIKVPVLNAGEYNITINYSGDDRYLANGTNSSLTVNKNKDVKISFSNLIFNGVTGDITISFKDWEDAGIYNADVTITIGSDVYELVTDVNGDVTITNLKLTRGKYPIKAVFNAVPDEYDEKTAQEFIIVKQQSVINIVDISNKAISGNLKDIDGKAIAGAKIVYTVGANKKTVITAKDGSFVIAAKSNGVYKIVFEGDETAASASATIKLNNVVTPTKKSTTIKASNKKFKVKAKNKIVSVVLLSGKTKLASKVISLKINKKTFKAKTNKKGVAKIKVKLSKKGKYSGVVSFAGDSGYTGSSKKIILVVK